MAFNNNYGFDFPRNEPTIAERGEMLRRENKRLSEDCIKILEERGYTVISPEATGEEIAKKVVEAWDLRRK